MKTIHSITFTILVLLPIIAKTQTPLLDPEHFILDTWDNFNSFDYNLWGSKLPNNTWGLETYDSSKVSAVGGMLTLSCDRVAQPFSANRYTYISGGIETVGTKAFPFGYFEVESQLPQSGVQGPWGGFWMHTGDGGWDEIDVLEPDGCDCKLGTRYNIGASATHSGIHSSTAIELGGFEDLSIGFNKYSVLWTPKYIAFFFNDSTVHEVVNPLYIPTHPMYVFLTFQVDPGGCSPLSNFPTMYWKFKKFKYYRLKTDCDNPLIAENFDFINHDYKVQKYIKLKNSIIPQSSNIVLRAKDFIELSRNINVPLGSTLTLITHNSICPR